VETFQLIISGNLKRGVALRERRLEVGEKLLWRVRASWSREGHTSHVNIGHEAKARQLE
jgi:hypothetical protein